MLTGRRLEGIAVALLLGAAGCGEHTFSGPVKLGGKTVDAETLNHGKEMFTLYCRACHGDKGNGTGPASYSYRPPPRDFTVGLFKFAAVSPGSLPHDEDLQRIVRYGLHGTPMLAWEISDDDLHDVIQYIKTFSDRWKTEEAGDVIATTPDPWGAGKKAEAIERGKKVYHGLSQCLSCHPAYESKQYIYEASKELAGSGTTEFRDNMYYPEAKDTDYTDKNYPKVGDDYPHLKLLPPDFLFNEVRSVRDINDPKTSYGDLYRIIASGIGGTAMPQWQGALPETDLWSLAYYVHSLIELRGTTQSVAMRDRIMGQPAWTPPAEVPVPAPAAPAAAPKKAKGRAAVEAQRRVDVLRMNQRK
jgi:mono/diheme cytochrome c family protein